MADIPVPSISELWDAYFVPTEDQADPTVPFELVSEEVKDKWRHGLVEEAVFRRKSDDTYWAVVYATTADGETNEFRSGEVEPVRVVPRTYTVTTYESAI